MGIIEYTSEDTDSANGFFRWGDDLAPTTGANKNILSRWNDLRGDKRCPLFEALDLLDFAEHLPQLSLLQSQPEVPAFLVKIMGSVTVGIYGVDATGYAIKPTGGSGGEERLFTLYNTIVDIRGPATSTSRIIMGTEGPLKNFVENETLLLPFADASGTVTHILSHQDVVSE